MSNEAPENFISKLPPAPLVTPDITDGVLPLPPVSLAGEGEVHYVNRKSPGEPDPKEIREQAEAATDITLFADGSAIKYVERPGHAPQCILVDATGNQLAICRNQDISEFLCNAANCFVIASLKAKEEGKQVQVFHKPIILPGV